MDITLLLKRIWVLVMLSFGIAQLSFAQNPPAARLFGSEAVSPISVSVSGKLALCSHSEKGTIILGVTGGKAPYTFKWNTNETTQNRTNLFAGTYTVNITDADGVLHVERIVVQPPYPLILDPLEKRDASCGSGADGYAKIGVKIGRGEPYGVTWSHGLQDSWEASNLAPGTYTVTVSDIFNCDVSISFEIEAETEGMNLTESIKQPDCSSPNSGEINLNVTGGSAPYQFSWSHGPSTSSLTGLVAGDYSVMIIDQSGCAIQASYNLQAPSSMEVTVAATNPSCENQNGGSISLDISGGQAPYTVSWTNGQGGTSLSNLPAGTYQASISDALGCTTQQVVSLSQPPGITMRVQETLPVSCFGSSDGVAKIELEGDLSGISIIWSDGVKDVLTRSDLIAGSYTVRVTNGSGCETTQTFSIGSPNELSARIESALDVDCSVGSVEGVAWVSIQGGTEPYTIAWGESKASNREINFSQTTTLQVTITDAKGCTISAESKVDFPSNTTSEGRLDFNYRKLEISSEPEVQVDEEIIFESEISEEFIAWEWAFGDGKQSVDKDPIHVFEKAGIYEVTLTGYDIYGCSSVETNSVQVNSPQDMVVIPNAFTPNGDGLNDTFMPKLKSVSAFSINIFNTWGERMFSTTQAEDKGWDGTYNGQLLPAGNYLYNITYTTPEGEIINRTGGVTLIR